MTNRQLSAAFGMPSLSMSGSQASPMPSWSTSAWSALASSGQLSVVSAIPSVSSSGSHGSPSPSWSPSVCVAFDTSGQLSDASGIPSPSLSGGVTRSVSEAVLLAGAGSRSDRLIVAVFVIGVVRSAFTITVIDRTADAPAASVPMSHVTTPAASVQSGAKTKLVPSGSGSLIETLVAGAGPLLLATSVYVVVSPAVSVVRPSVFVSATSVGGGGGMTAMPNMQAVPQVGNGPTSIAPVAMLNL